MNLDAMVSDSSPERTRTDAPSRRRASSLSLPLSLLSMFRELEADVLCMQGTTDEFAALKLALARTSSDFDLPKPILPLSSSHPLLPSHMSLRQLFFVSHPL